MAAYRNSITMRNSTRVVVLSFMGFLFSLTTVGDQSQNKLDIYFQKYNFGIIFWDIERPNLNF